MEGDSGVFTELRSGARRRAADILGNVSVASIYAYVDQALGAGSTSALRVHVAHARLNASWRIDIAILRRLPEVDSDDAEFPLSPRHEHTAKPQDSAAEETFRYLQRCNRVKLVEPIDEEDMYYAAMNSTGCRLTALGRFYWKLADDGRI